jgi:hypothetical protein
MPYSGFGVNNFPPPFPAFFAEAHELFAAFAEGKFHRLNRNSTFCENELVAERHSFDFNAEIYG